MTTNHPRFSTLVSRRIAISAMLVAGIGTTSILSGCDSFAPRVHQYRSMQVPHLAGTAVSATSANGWIEAIQTDRVDVGIEVDLYGRDEERLNFATVHADRMGDNTLRIWVEWPGGKRVNNEGATIAIQLPDAVGIELQSSNGHLTITGLSGHAQLKTSNGSIKVDRHDGSIYADTSNGKLQAEHVSGEIEMYSSNGKVIITDAFGPIQAETSNGHVYVSTMDGNEGPVRIRTSNGRIDLDLGDGFEGVLKAKSSNGKISVVGIENARLIESSKNRVELQIGDSNEVSAAQTSNGSVRIRGRHTEPMDD